MFAHVIAAVLMISLGQTPGGPAKDGAKPPPRKTTSQQAEKKSDKPDKKDAKGGKEGVAATDRAVKAMNMVVADADFQEMAFEDFVEWLGRFTDANVVVRWKVLEKEGIERDQPITLKQKNIKIRKLLGLVFEQLTAELRSVELAAKADGNTLMISTKQELNIQLITRSYDVQDLLLTIPDFTGCEPGQIGKLTPMGDHMKRDGGPAVAKGGSESGEKDDPAERLIRVITTNIQPLSWKVNGGKGTIKSFKGRLVVYNNVEVHQQLAGYLGGTPEKSEADRKE
jgi:hypothetical protein